jgi:hypothetical protein
LTPCHFNATLSSVLDLPPQTSFSLTNLVPECDARFKEFNLTSSPKFPDGFVGDFRVTYESTYLDIDGQYALLRDSNQSLPPTQIPSKLHDFLTGSPQFSEHRFNLYLHRFFFLTLRDIAHQTISPLVRSLIPLLLTSDLLSTVLIDVFSHFFGESTLWERPKIPIDTTEWKYLISFLAGQVFNHRISPIQIRQFLAPFRPSILSESFPISLILKLRERCPDSEVHRIISDLFSDNFLFRCFRDSGTLLKVLLATDLNTILPYVAIRCYVGEVLLGQMDGAAFPFVISSIGISAALLSSDRIVRAVIDPIFAATCDIVSETAVPYLEMSPEELGRLVNVMDDLAPIMRFALGDSGNVHVAVLVRLQQLLVKRSFQPKGLCFVWFAFLFDRGILHPAAYDEYLLLDTQVPSPGRNSVLMEVNAYVMAVVPNQFPNIPKHWKM